MGIVHDYRELRVWQTAEKVFEMVCDDVKKFPKNKVAWIIEDQLLRAAGSIGANIAEGFNRKTKNDVIHFFIISRGSAAETEVWILRSERRKFLTTARREEYFQKLMEIKKMINSFNYKLRNSKTYLKT